MVLGTPAGRIGPICRPDADQVWRQLHEEVGKANRKYFGLDGATARFLRFFPQGFGSADYFREERDYKDKAKKKLDANVPLAEAVTGSGFGEAVLSIFNATNLLSPFEKTRLRPFLRGSSADAFIRAAANFTQNADAAALHEMERVLRPHDCAKWTIVTYLPFLWRPDVHMFLKPRVTRDFAERVKHRFRFDYRANLDLDVYESLLDMVGQTEKALIDLRPRDRIDVQSFIWVVGPYNEVADAPKT